MVTRVNDSVSRLEAIHADGSGSSAATHDRELWSRPGTVCLAFGKNRGGNAAGGAGRARVSNPARRQVEVSRFHDECAGDRVRGRFCLHRTCLNGVDGVNGLVVDGTEHFIVRLALWCEMLLSPAGEGAGHKFRVSLSNQFSCGFLVVLLNKNLTTSPGVVGGFATALAGFSTTAGVPCLQ